jgi:hypothetical protein
MDQIEDYLEACSSGSRVCIYDDEQGQSIRGCVDKSKLKIEI